MTDTLQVQGAFAPADSSSVAATEAAVAPEALATDTAADAAAPQAPAAPNGFVELGLAPELVQAVADLGYTQPTGVQERAIPWPWVPVPTPASSST